MQLRNTSSKQLVRRIYEESRVPLTVSEAYALASKRDQGLAFSTVYRITQQLIVDQLLESQDLRDRNARYEWASRAHHHHVTCSRCGTIADIGDALLSLQLDNVQEQTGFIVQGHAVELTGLCPKCKRKI